MQKNLIIFISCIILLGTTLLTQAQVTTATLSGIVSNKNGSPLASATVTVEFSDAGIKQTLTTRADG